MFKIHEASTTAFDGLAQIIHSARSYGRRRRAQDGKRRSFPGQRLVPIHPLRAQFVPQILQMPDNGAASA